MRELGGFDEKMRFVEDYDLWSRMALQSEVAVETTPLADVRSHAEHFTSDRVGNLSGWASLYEKMETLVPTRRLRALCRERKGELFSVAGCRASACPAIGSACAGPSSRPLARVPSVRWAGCALLAPPRCRAAARQRRRRERLIMEPIVSIVMPTFNRMEFLPAAVESVLLQTMPDWELDHRGRRLERADARLPREPDARRAHPAAAAAPVRQRWRRAQRRYRGGPSRVAGISRLG